ncbi:MAG: hypothetical protein LUI85_19460 [Bacteroides sp.]|nr:hypothetical protein [Bacteroides sp.]
MLMYKKDIKKKVYIAPIVKKQQILLEQVIAAGSKKISSYGDVQHEWTEEDIYDEEYYTID